MRFFTFLNIVFAFAFFVNDSIAQTKSFAYPLKECDKDITEVAYEISRMEKNAKNLTLNLNLFDDPIIRPTMYTINSDIAQITVDCCFRFKTIISDKYVSTILDYLSLMVDEYTKFFTTLSSKKQIIDKEEMSFSEAKYIITTLSDMIIGLLECLSSKNTASLKSAKTALLDKLNKAYSNAKVVYNL